MFTHDYNGKKELVKVLSQVYKNIKSNIVSIELKRYIHLPSSTVEELIVLTWDNGVIVTLSNTMRTLVETAEDVTRMINSCIFQNEYHKAIMETSDWVEI